MVLNIDELKEYAKTHTAEECAEHFDRTTGYIYILQRKEHFKTISKIERRSVAVLDYVKTHSVYEAAEHFSLTVNQIRNVCQKAGVKAYRPKKPEQIKRAINISRELGENALTVYARNHKISKQAVSQMLNGVDFVHVWIPKNIYERWLEENECTI